MVMEKGMGIGEGIGGCERDKRRGWGDGEGESGGKERGGNGDGEADRKTWESEREKIRG